jgi:acyl-CoA hydrolase
MPWLSCSYSAPIAWIEFLRRTGSAPGAQAMISIAHPDYREELTRQAREHGLIPKGFS